MQISPLPCSCTGKRQQEAERAVQPLLAASTRCGTHTAPLVFKGPAPENGQAQCLNILVAGGEHLSPKLSAELHRAGPSYRGCWMPDTLFAVFGLQRNTRGKKKKKISGIHVMSEHPRQFSPWQVLLVLCDKPQQEHRVDGCSKPKLETGAKIRLQKFLSKPGYYFFLFVIYVNFCFSDSTLAAQEPPVPSQFPRETWNKLPAEAQCSQRYPWIQSTVFPFIFIFIWSSQNLLWSN